MSTEPQSEQFPDFPVTPRDEAMWNAGIDRALQAITSVMDAAGSAIDVCDRIADASSRVESDLRAACRALGMARERAQAAKTTEMPF